MITVLADGEGRHRLEDATGKQVGWVHGRTIGFRGMRGVDEALAIAAVAWPRLEAVLRRHYFGRPAQEPAWDRLRLVHDGAYEWVSDGEQPLARLRRPTADRAVEDYALEFVLPTYATEGVVVSVAQAVATALRPHLSSAAGAPASASIGRSRPPDVPAPA